MNIKMEPPQLQAFMAQSSLNKSGLAKALGISRNTLDGYLNGKHPIPKLVFLACEALAIHGRAMYD